MVSCCAAAGSREVPRKAAPARAVPRNSRRLVFTDISRTNAGGGVPSTPTGPQGPWTRLRKRYANAIPERLTPRQSPPESVKAGLRAGRTVGTRLRDQSLAGGYSLSRLISEDVVGVFLSWPIVCRQRRRIGRSADVRRGPDAEYCRIGSRRLLAVRGHRPRSATGNIGSRECFPAIRAGGAAPCCVWTDLAAEPRTRRGWCFAARPSAPGMASGPRSCSSNGRGQPGRFSAREGPLRCRD